VRIAFVAANRETMPDCVIPLGVLHVMASVPAGQEVVLWDLCFEPDPPGFLASALASFRPDVVAIGLRNIQSNDYSGCQANLDAYRALVGVVREHSDAPVVVGGGGFSVMPEELMTWLQPDFGIAGEGERSFAQLVAMLERGASPPGIAGLYRWELRADGGRGVVADPTPRAWQDLDALPIPDRRWVDPRHFQRYGIDSVQTKRGCALACSYCTYPRIEGKASRQRDPARVVDEMFASLEAQPGIRHVFIVDSVFNLPPRHAKAVCRELVARGWRVPWTAYINPIGFDAELAEGMVAAGCAGVEVGSDSGVDAVLARLHKGFGTADIERLHRTCVAAGLPDCHTYILGTWGETLDDVHRTLDFCRGLDAYATILMTWVDDLESLSPELAVGRAALRDAVASLLREEGAKQPTWVMPGLGVNFDPALFAWLRRSGASGPLWQGIRRSRSAGRLTR